MSNSGENVNVKQFARMIGRSHVWVYKLIKKGVIPRNEDGSIPLKAAMQAYKERRLEYGGGQMAKKDKGKKAEAQRPAGVDPLAGLDKSIDLSNAMQKAKLAEKTYQAKLRELDYKLKNGELVEVAAVANEAAWLAEQVKSKLLAIPPRISGLCEGRPAREIEEIITDAINGALKELQKCKYQ